MKRSPFIVIAAILCLTFLACQKDTPSPSPEDCVTLTNVQLLTQKEYEIDALLRSDAGLTTQYKKGGQNTTGVTYQNLKLKFNADNTGTYTDEVGTVHTLNWSFTSTDERNMQLVIGPPFANTFIWNLVEIEGKYLHNATPYGNGLISVRYMQIP